MALVTVQRSPSSSRSSNSSSSYISEAEDETDDRRLRHQKSFNESFFAVKGAALILPQSGENIFRPVTKHPVVGDLQTHLQAMFMLLRPRDTIKLAVRLESMDQTRIRYMVVVSCIGREDTQESVILGIDYTDKATIGLVLPIWRDTNINLDGDGGFTVTCASSERTHIFKPVSVQALWSALQCLHKNADNARLFNYYTGGLNLTWTCYYESRIDSDQVCINEWNEMEDVLSHKTGLVPILDNDAYATQKELTEKLIKVKLREIMMKVDIDNVTSKQIRILLEEETEMNLKEFKSYIDEQMIIILRQMDAASEIFEHVFLGSEWNASNLEELKCNGIGYILNITREIDNFYPELFEYKNVRVYDNEETDLLKFWDDTFKFMDKAREQGSKVFVHCKMGISRSSATVIAYAMKEYNWSLKQAITHVKEKRNCIQPNDAFMSQLEEYEGILGASQQRHNKLWRSKSETNLKGNDSDQRGSEHDVPPFVPDGLLTTDDLREMMMSPRPKSWSPDDAMANKLLDSMDEISSDVVMPQEEDDDDDESAEDVLCRDTEEWPPDKDVQSAIQKFEMTTEKLEIEHVDGSEADISEEAPSAITIVVTPTKEDTENLTFEEALTSAQGQNGNEFVPSRDLHSESDAKMDDTIDVTDTNTDVCAESKGTAHSAGVFVDTDITPETVSEWDKQAEKSDSETVKELVKVELNDIGPSGQIVSEIAVIDKSSWTCVKRETKELPPREFAKSDIELLDDKDEQCIDTSDDQGVNGNETVTGIDGISTYVKESIPWNPGTVQRQKLELEEKLKGKLQEHESKYSRDSQESSKETSGNNSRCSPHSSSEDLRPIESMEEEKYSDEHMDQDVVAMEIGKEDEDFTMKENMYDSADDGHVEAIPEPGTVKRTMEIFHKIEKETKEKTRSRSSSHGKSSHSSYSSNKSSRSNSIEDVQSVIKTESSNAEDLDNQGQDNNDVMEDTNDEQIEASHILDSDDEDKNGKHIVIVGQDIVYVPGSVKKYKQDFEQKLEGAESQGKEKLTSPVEHKEFVKEDNHSTHKDVIIKEAGENSGKATDARKESKDPSKMDAGKVKDLKEIWHGKDPCKVSDAGKMKDFKEICDGKAREKCGSETQSPVEEYVLDRVQVESHDMTDMECKEVTDSAETTAGTDSMTVIRTYYQEETIDWPVGTVKQQRLAIEGKKTKETKVEEEPELKHELVKEGKLTVEELKTIRGLGKVILGKPEEKTTEIAEKIDTEISPAGMSHSCSDENLSQQTAPQSVSVREKARQLEMTGTFDVPDMKKSASIAKITDDLISPDSVTVPELPAMDTEMDKNNEELQPSDDDKSSPSNQEGTVKDLVGIFNRHSACLESEKREDYVETEGTAVESKTEGMENTESCSGTYDIPDAGQEREVEKEQTQTICDKVNLTTSQGKQRYSLTESPTDGNVQSLPCDSDSVNVGATCVKSTGHVDAIPGLDPLEATTYPSQAKELIGTGEDSSSCRKVRMQHGKSHPLSKLNPKRSSNPFYNTM